jgi:hypothetical protein
LKSYFYRRVDEKGIEECNEIELKLEDLIDDPEETG